MDIAYFAIIFLLWIVALVKFSGNFIRLLLTIFLLLGGWFLWFNVVAGMVPDDYEYLPIQGANEWMMQTASDFWNGTGSGSGGSLSEAQLGAKDKIINKFTEFVEINDDGTRNIDEDLAEKMKNIDLPDALQDDIDMLEGSVGAARAFEQEMMDQLGQ